MGPLYLGEMNKCTRVFKKKHKTEIGNMTDFPFLIRLALPESTFNCILNGRPASQWTNEERAQENE